MPGPARSLVVLAACAAAVGGAPPLSAQSREPPTALASGLQVLALHDLSFGTVLRGIASSIAVHDPRHAGLFEIQGPADASVRVEFVLPAALVADVGGSLLALQFGPGDGFVDFSRGRPPRGQVFDPRTPLVATLGPNGRLFVRLGGTVLPTPLQVGGAYRATIVLTVYDLGS